MPEEEKPTLIERLAQTLLRQVLGGMMKNCERFVKRMLRMAAISVAGVILAVLGVAFLGVGVVKWFNLMMPNWLAWLLVGVIMLLIGLAVTLGTLASSRD